MLRPFWTWVVGLSVLGLAVIAVVTLDRGAVALTAAWAVFGFVHWALKPYITNLWVEHVVRPRQARSEHN